MRFIRVVFLAFENGPWKIYVCCEREREKKRTMKFNCVHNFNVHVKYLNFVISKLNVCSRMIKNQFISLNWLDAVHLILKEEHFDTIGLCKCLKTSLQTHYHHHQTVMNTFFFVITGISNLATSTLSLFYSKVFSGKKNSENMSGKLTEKKQMWEETTYGCSWADCKLKNQHVVNMHELRNGIPMQYAITNT